jgi:hypothetical protein
MIREMTVSVRLCRYQLEDNKRETPHVSEPVGLTDAEFDCFTECLRIRVAARSALLAAQAANHK